MTDPTDNPRRPARRFSALRPLVRSPGRQRNAGPREADVQSPPATEGSADEARIAKVMARAGLCSRRDAESWILAGRVAVNGSVIDSPALNIGPRDAITVDGSPIEKAERTRLFLYHKQRGLVTTARDPEGRPTIYDALPEDLPRLVTVGRLDINTEGLLLLTNDGGLSRMLELPSTGWVRRYRVRANGSVDQGSLDRLAAGISIDGVDYAGIEAKLDRQQGANVWLTMGLREGKNREIKRVLEHLGLAVTRLIRISFGPFQLGDLAEGAVEEIRTQVLRDQLGPTLSREAGVDFSGPVTAAIVTREVRREKAAERRAAREKREAPPPERPRSSRAPDAPRQHVASRRAERAEAVAEGPRRRTERSATADRKGRAVAVERITTPGRARDEAVPNRNARRFERDRRDDVGGGAKPAPFRARQDRSGPKREEARPPRGAERPDRGGARPFRARLDAEAAPPRGEETRRPRTVRQADRTPPSFGGDERPHVPRPGGRERPQSDARPERPGRSRFDRDERPRTKAAGSAKPGSRDGGGFGKRDDRPGARPPRPNGGGEGAVGRMRPGGDRPGGPFRAGPRPSSGGKPPGGGGNRGGGGGGRRRPPG